MLTRRSKILPIVLLPHPNEKAIRCIRPPAPSFQKPENKNDKNGYKKINFGVSHERFAANHAGGKGQTLLNYLQIELRIKSGSNQ